MLTRRSLSIIRQAMRAEGRLRGAALRRADKSNRPQAEVDLMAWQAANEALDHLPLMSVKQVQEDIGRVLQDRSDALHERRNDAVKVCDTKLAELRAELVEAQHEEAVAAAVEAK